MWDFVYYGLIVVAVVAAMLGAYYVGLREGYDQAMNALESELIRWWPGDKCIHGKEGARIVEGKLKNDSCCSCKTASH